MVTLTAENSRRGYTALYTKARLKDARRDVAYSVARRLNSNRTRYQSAALGRMPWVFPAIVHNLESGGNFTRHLHNGDPLTARTKHVPAGRPATGTPPFSWEQSAADALTMKGLNRVSNWDLPRLLFEFERYNGFGYVARKVNSPYVWSFTDQYARGKYIADGKFSATAVSEQCGAAATLKAMEALKIYTPPAPMLTEAQKQSISLDKPISPIVRSPIKAPEWDLVGWIIKLVKGIFAS